MKIHKFFQSHVTHYNTISHGVYPPSPYQVRGRPLPTTRDRRYIFTRNVKIILLYRNFHFIYAGYRVAWIIPLLGGVRGGFLGREISVNISRIPPYPPLNRSTELTTKSPPRGDFLICLY